MKPKIEETLKSHENQDVSYELIRSKRKTIGIQITKQLKILIRAPLKTPIKTIEQVLASNISWVQKHRELQREKNLRPKPQPLTPEEIKALKADAARVLPQRVSYYSALMGLTPSAVKITSATTRWGSCSGKNSLCFSYRLMLLPPSAVDYIVVHELAHIAVKNHGKDFYALVSKFLPDYKARVACIRKLEKQL